MKLQQLRQIIREEISSLEERPPSSGIISFEQLKQAVIENYEVKYGITGEELNKAKSPNELVNILDGLAFNGKEAYDFIFESILIDKF